MKTEVAQVTVVAMVVEKAGSGFLMVAFQSYGIMPLILGRLRLLLNCKLPPAF
ncbi:MAG: hypothetical protein QXJ07_00575 [Candidatus Bathyarchaeia archaeon]